MNENKKGIVPTLAISCENFEKITNRLEVQKQEIERLTNIINELEKILKECMQHYDYLYDEFEEKEALDTYYDYKYVFDKLQELKGDSSND